MNKFEEELNYCDKFSVPIEDVLKHIDEYLNIDKLEKFFDENDKLQSSLYNEKKLIADYENLLKELKILKPKIYINQLLEQNNQDRKKQTNICNKKNRLLHSVFKCFGCDNKEEVNNEFLDFDVTIGNVIGNYDILSDEDTFKYSYYNFIIEVKNLELNFAKNIENLKKEITLAKINQTIDSIKTSIKVLEKNSYYKLIKNVRKTNQFIKYLENLQEKNIQALDTKFKEYITNDLEAITLLEEYNILKSRFKEIKTENLKDLVEFEKSIQQLENLINHRIFIFKKHYYHKQTVYNKSLLIRLLILTYFFDFTVEEIQSVIEYPLNEKDTNTNNITVAYEFLYPNEQDKSDIDTDTLFECYKRLPTTLGITVKQIFYEIEIHLQNSNYQLRYSKDKTKSPFLYELKKTKNRVADYKNLAILFLFIIVCWVLWFDVFRLCVQEIYPKFLFLNINPFIYTAIPAFLTMSFAGFTGMLIYGWANQKISHYTKIKILEDIRYSHNIKVKITQKQLNEQKVLKEEQILKEKDRLKERFSTDVFYINFDDHLQNLVRSISNEDAQSKSISRKSKRLRHSFDKVYIMKNNQLTKTGRLLFITGFMRDLTIYTEQLNVQNSRQIVDRESIDIIKEERNIINQIEAKITLASASKIFLFFAIPIAIFLAINKIISITPIYSLLLILCALYVILFFDTKYSIAKDNSRQLILTVICTTYTICMLYVCLIYNKFIDTPYVLSALNIPLSLYLAIAIFILLIPTGYLGYSIFKFASIRKINCIKKFTGWRQDSTKIEDYIANIYELIAFFIATSLLLGFYYLISCDLFFTLPKDNMEKQFFYTIMSSIFPIEIFGDELTEYSLLFHTVDGLKQSDGLRYTIRFLSVILTTTVFVSLVRLLTDKYRRYSYDEHSYNAFLPPELLRIFGYFTVFIIATGMAYALVVSEVKKIQNNDIQQELCQKQNCNVISGTKATRFGFSDFLPYSIFLALIGAGFSLSTKELLENYFSGISQRVDSSFEEDDMVTIGSSELMQVKNIGFKNVTFFDINKNANRYISFKQLDKEKIINFTEPTLHFRRNIKLFIAKDQSFAANSPLIADKPVTLRAEMLLLLSAFYVNGVQLPRSKSLKRIRLTKVRKVLYNPNEEDREAHKNLHKFFKNNDKKLDNILTIDAQKSTDKNTNTLSKLHKNLSDIINSKDTDENPNNEDYLLYLKSIEDVKNILSDKKYRHVEAIKDRIKDLVRDIEKGIDIVKVFYAYIRYECEKYNVYIHYNNENKILEKISFIYDIETKELSKKPEIREDVERIRKINIVYQKLLIILADKAVEISYLYYDIALTLWSVKDEEEHLPKNEKRSLDTASLALLNVPRVTSTNVQHENLAMWKIELEVTLKLAEQSDEIIHHMNQFIDKYYVLFIGNRINNQHSTNN